MLDTFTVEEDSLAKLSWLVQRCGPLWPAVPWSHCVVGKMSNAIDFTMSAMIRNVSRRAAMSKLDMTRRICVYHADCTRNSYCIYCTCWDDIVGIFVSLQRSWWGAIGMGLSVRSFVRPSVTLFGFQTNRPRDRYQIRWILSLWYSSDLINSWSCSNQFLLFYGLWLVEQIPRICQQNDDQIGLIMCLPRPD